MAIRKISILGGYGRGGNRDPVDRVDLAMGDVLSIVGPTGSGKTALINDIGLFAGENTPSRRRVLINDAVPSIDFLDDRQACAPGASDRPALFFLPAPVHAPVAPLWSGQRRCEARERHAGKGGRDMDRLGAKKSANSTDSIIDSPI